MYYETARDQAEFLSMLTTGQRVSLQALIEKKATQRTQVRYLCVIS